MVIGPDKIDDGIELLQSASELIAHNGICFDIPAIKKLYPSFSTHEMVVTDTLVLSRLLHADMKNEDADRAFTGKTDFEEVPGQPQSKSMGLQTRCIER